MQNKATAPALIEIKATEDTPNVLLDSENRLIRISGRSLPEDVTVFYNPILFWLDEYKEAKLSDTKVVLNLEYFNTASSKLILDILMKLEEIHEGGNDVLVEWHYHEDDEDMEEAGEEYSELIEVPFKLVSFNDDEE